MLLNRHTYNFDAENRLRSAAVNSALTPSIFYDYDPLGRRASKTVSGTSTLYLLDGDEEIAELNSTGAVLRRYITGPAIDDRIATVEGSSIAPTAAAKTYYHTNHQGSVMAMTDATGNATGCAVGTNCQRLSYDEYGNLSQASVATGQPYRYTGRRFDAETGLYYYRARYYSPDLGRFLSIDPVGYKADSNLYAYVYNNPLNKADPTGLEPGDVFSTPAAAADDALNFINPTSVRENTEYGGAIVPKNDGYAATEPQRGEGTKVQHAVPKNASGDYHTHGDYSKPDKKGESQRTTKSQDAYRSDHFSRDDKTNSKILQKATGNPEYKSYLGTPSGENKHYDPMSKKETPITVPDPEPTVPGPGAERGLNSIAPPSDACFFGGRGICPL